MVRQEMLGAVGSIIRCCFNVMLQADQSVRHDGVGSMTVGLFSMTVYSQ